MRNIVILLASFLYVIAGCKPEPDEPECKNLNRKDIIGKWKLVEVAISKNNQDFVMFDYSNDSIIYEFQDNNRLVIIGLADSLQLFDDFKEGEHFYEYRQRNPCSSSYPGPNLSIDPHQVRPTPYFCTALLYEQTMSISGDIYIGGVISGNGVMVGGDNYRLGQTLEKLK